MARSEHEGTWTPVIAWIGLVTGVASLVVQFFSYLAEYRVRERLLLTPISLRRDFGMDENITVDIALANTGNRSAILGELCMLPQPWIPGSFDPDSLSQFSEHRVIPSVTGLSWRVEPGGAVHAPVTVEPGEVQSVRAYFDVSRAAEWIEMGNKNGRVDIEFFAATLDQQGTVRVSKLADWFAITGPTAWQTSVSAPTELLPGEQALPAGRSTETPSSSYCMFIGSVFGPVGASLEQRPGSSGIGEEGAVPGTAQ